MRFVLMFIDGEFSKSWRQPSLAEAKAFADGVRAGADEFAGSGLSVYVWPEEGWEMLANEPVEACNAAIRATKGER